MIKARRLLKAIGFTVAIFGALTLLITVGILFKAYVNNGEWWFLGLVGFVCCTFFIYGILDVSSE